MAAAEDLVLEARVALEMGEPPGGARAFASVELETEDKSASTGIVKSEMSAVGDLVLGAGLESEDKSAIT